MPVTAKAAGTEAVLGNYTITEVDATLSVAMTVTAADKTKVYGNANPEATGTVTGVKNGDAVTGAYNTDATVTTGIGSHKITARRPAPRRSWATTITEVDATLSVTRAR